MTHIDKQTEIDFKRWSQLQAARSPWEKVWRDLGKYFIPHRSNVNLNPTPGQSQTTELYDAVGVHASELLASSMAGSLTSPAIRWFSLHMRDEKFGKKKAVKLWLEQSANLVYHELRQSNFHTEALECYKDIGSLGTMALFCDERKKKGKYNGIRFQALSLGEYAFSEDEEGRADTLFRTFKLTRQAAVAKWGLENVSEKTRDLLHERPDEKIEILHAVYPRHDAKDDAKQSKLLPWASVYYEVEAIHKLDEGGYHEFPYFVTRWDKTSGEEYGRGPGHTALPNVKTLNKIQEMFLKALAKVIDPPMKQRHNGVIGKVKLQPSSLNTVIEMDDLQPIQFGSNFAVTYQEKGDLRAEIRHVFFWDQLQLQQGTQMTATEVERRFELMQRLLGPTLGRLEWEFLNPLIERVMNIMHRNGQLPETPDELIEAAANNNDSVDVKYEGPLARAQRGSEVQAVERTMTMALSLQPLFPEIADNWDEDELADFISEANGLSKRIIRDKAKKQELRAGRAEGAAKAAETQQGLAQSEAVRNLAGAAQAAGMDGSQPSGGIAA